MTDTLTDAIDEGWKALLARCSQVDADGKSAVKIGEQVEALVAAAKWLETKGKLAPPPEKPEEGKRFDRIRAEFHGAPRNRGGRPRTKDREAGGAGVAADATETSPANGRAYPAAEAGAGERVDEPDAQH